MYIKFGFCEQKVWAVTIAYLNKSSSKIDYCDSLKDCILCQVNSLLFMMCCIYFIGDLQIYMTVKHLNNDSDLHHKVPLISGHTSL